MNTPIPDIDPTAPLQALNQALDGVFAFIGGLAVAAAIGAALVIFAMALSHRQAPGGAYAVYFIGAVVSAFVSMMLGTWGYVVWAVAVLPLLFLLRGLVRSVVRAR